MVAIEEQRMWQEVLKAQAPQPTVTPLAESGSIELENKSYIMPIEKSKVKTRPLTDTQQANQEIESQDLDAKQSEDLEPTTQQVTKRAYEMLTVMFPTTATEASNKSIEWDAFVLAMADMGFSARNCGGSAVSFESKDLSDKRRIIFHKPHPSSRIDFVLLRSMGRRMKKWFGWQHEGSALAD